MKKYIALALMSIFVTLAVYRPSYLKTPVYAWWGSMYPQYCFSETEQEDAPVKIGFRCKILQDLLEDR
ncbi:MAG: hypothetical protein HFH60_11995 [Lachnospiraceae bacterium]|nr:hypothetical protein [Lachnospiraceae bacterium]